MVPFHQIFYEIYYNDHLAFAGDVRTAADGLTLGPYRPFPAKERNTIFALITVLLVPSGLTSDPNRENRPTDPIQVESKVMPASVGDRISPHELDDLVPAYPSDCAVLDKVMLWYVSIVKIYRYPVLHPVLL